MANKLKTYLLNHPEIDENCSKTAQVHYLTTENPEVFNENAARFLAMGIQSESIHF